MYFIFSPTRKFATILRFRMYFRLFNLYTGKVGLNIFLAEKFSAKNKNF